MARRMVLGQTAYGMDLCITRAGHDAYTVDVNNRFACSFSARRQAMAKLTVVGEAYALNSQVYFGTSFAEPPVVGYATKQYSGTVMDLDNLFGVNSNRWQEGTPFVAIVRTNSVEFTFLNQLNDVPRPAFDKFPFFVIET